MKLRGLTAGILAVFTVLVVFNPGLLAQNTSPVSVTFPVMRMPTDLPIGHGLAGMFPSISLWERTSSLNVLAYTTNRAVGLDSVFFPADSISKRLTGETLYQITVRGRGYGTVTNTTDNGVRSDSTIKITMRKITQRSDSSATYTVWRKRANRRVIDDLGFTFNSNVKSGQKFEIAMTYDKPLEFLRDAGDALAVADTSIRNLYDAQGNLLTSDTSLNKTGTGQLIIWNDTTSTLFTREKSLFPPW